MLCDGGKKERAAGLCKQCMLRFAIIATFYREIFHIFHEQHEAATTLFVMVSTLESARVKG